MRRISDEKFLEIMPNQDTVVGIRVKDGEFYFLACMENAENYKIQQAISSNGYLMDRHQLIVDGDIFSCIQLIQEYKNMYWLYQTYNGNLIYTDEIQFQNEYEEFLSLIKCYERNGVSNPDDHDILILSKDELSSFCDLLRDGDYILIIQEEN